jgi:hypothetical protein
MRALTNKSDRKGVTVAIPSCNDPPETKAARALDHREINECCIRPCLRTGGIVQAA